MSIDPEMPLPYSLKIIKVCPNFLIIVSRGHIPNFGCRSICIFAIDNVEKTVKILRKIIILRGSTSYRLWTVNRVAGISHGTNMRFALL